MLVIILVSVLGTYFVDILVDILQIYSDGNLEKCNIMLSSHYIIADTAQIQQEWQKNYSK